MYLNDWLNPQGKSFVDLAVRIRGVRATKSLNVYIPFRVSEAELTGRIDTTEDISAALAAVASPCRKNRARLRFNSTEVDSQNCRTPSTR